MVDLDLTVCLHVFGLRAFDKKMPVTRMLPGSNPCDLRLFIPDTTIGQDGFHDVVIENLIGTSTWRSRHVSPSDVIGLRRRWPQAVFQVMRERSVELEDLRRKHMRDYSRHIDTLGGAIAWCATLEGNTRWIHI